MYDLLAQVYDMSGQSRFSLKMAGYLLEILALRRSKARRIVDLACGTGAAAVALARRGYQVTGVDGSEAMLDRARARAARWGVQVDWRQQDLAALDLPGPYEVATCFYDSLNHLTDRLAVQQAFFGARRLLQPGGLFFFDMNTAYAYAKVWGSAEDSHLDARYARFWRSSYDRPTGLATLQATYFVREEAADAGPQGPEAAGAAGDRYRRIELTHHARGYDPDEVGAMLRGAGFKLLEAYECLSLEPASLDSYRVAYLAQA
jgi:2-polyprenyl-3-methyl-5-hydroxy-6-metoxy-1,4-benzoquinol methylase